MGSTNLIFTELRSESYKHMWTEQNTVHNTACALVNELTYRTLCHIPG